MNSLIRARRQITGREQGVSKGKFRAFSWLSAGFVHIQKHVWDCIITVSVTDLLWSMNYYRGNKM